MTVSNVPGPQFDLWFGGCRIEALYPIGPIVEGVGLNITALSYMGGTARRDARMQAPRARHGIDA